MSTSAEQARAFLRAQEAREFLRRKEEEEARKPKAYDPRGLGTAVTQGATWGWGDEVTAAATAGIAKMAGDDKPFKEIYRDVKEGERARQGEYIEANPGTAFAAEMAGAVAMPGRMLMGGKLPKTIAKSKPWQGHVARKASRRAEETALGGTRRRVFRNTGRGAATGAFAGAGYADTTEDLPEEMAKGAAFGVAVPLAMSGARNMTRFIGRRRPEIEPLGRGKDFMPIHLAADPKVSTPVDLYRRWVGKAFGGRKILGEQEARYLHKAKGAKEAARDALDQARQARTLSVRAKEAAKKADPTDSLLLRKMAANESLPMDVAADFRQQIGQRIDSNDMGGATEAIDNWWRTNGFGMVKGRQFEWDGSRLFDDLDALIKDNPGLALELGDVAQKIPGMAERMQTLVTRGEPPFIELARMFGAQRAIDGDAMLAMRNVFARAANRSGDAHKSGSMRQIANQFDKAFRRGLDPDGRRLFDDHIGRWGIKETFKESVLKAQTKKQGAFDPDDWMSSLGGDKKAYGKGPLQQAAQAAQKKRDAAYKKAKKAADKATDVRNKRVLEHRAMSERMRDLNARGLPKEVTPGQQTVATAVLGGPAAVIAGPAAGVAGAIGGTMGAGMMNASILASPWAQRAIAGQTKWQGIGQRQYQKLMSDSPLSKTLRSGTARGRSAYIRHKATEEEEY